jgi:hypothetical protein
MQWQAAKLADEIVGRLGPPPLTTYSHTGTHIGIRRHTL